MRTTAYHGDINYEPKRDGELQRSVLNNSKAMKVLGWEPKYSLESGVSELVSWLKA